MPERFAVFHPVKCDNIFVQIIVGYKSNALNLVFMSYDCGDFRIASIDEEFVKSCGAVHDHFGLDEFLEKKRRKEKGKMPSCKRF